MRFEDCDLINSKVKRKIQYIFEIYYKPAYHLGWDIEDSAWKLLSQHKTWEDVYTRYLEVNKNEDFHYALAGREITTETMTQDIRLPKCEE